MPRTVNSPLADLLTSQDSPLNPNLNPKQRNFRVVHVGDWVPDSLNITVTVDTSMYGGTVGNVITSLHVAPSINITTGNGIMPALNNVIFNDTDGTAQVIGVDFNTFAADRFLPHGYYFGNISACN
jgi:hypothetical protein